jgi:hypothetical protein
LVWLLIWALEVDLVGREVAARGCGNVTVAGDVPVTRVLDRAPHLQPWKGKPHEIILENYVDGSSYCLCDAR